MKSPRWVQTFARRTYFE